MNRPGRVTGSVAAICLVAACSSGDNSASTTIVPPTTIAATSSTATTEPVRPTATIAYTVIEAHVAGDDAAQAVVSNLYGWIGDRTVPEPDVPQGLLDHLAPIVPTEAMSIDATLSSADAFGGRVGVVTADDDVILLADEGSGWKVVGAKLARFGSDAWYGDPVRFLLVIGTDARPGQSQQLFRADSIHIASSNVSLHAGAVVGFPRDAYVDSSVGRDKFTNINALSERHSEEMVEIAAGLSGLPLEGYIITGFFDFERLVNDFGGVLVNVPFAMADKDAQAYLSAGLQRLWGANALAFSRNRHLNGGDFTRSFHQGLVILAALRGATEESITDLPELLSILGAHTWTDLALGDMVTLAATAFEIDPDSVENVVLKGTVATVGGASVVLLDEEDAARVFDDLSDGVLTPPG